MSASPITLATVRFFTQTGTLAPLAFGKLYSYAAGTNTPQALYSDAGGLSALPNPVILDANGEAQVWMGANAYKFNLLDAANVQQANWPQDNISSPAALAAAAQAAAQAFATAADDDVKTLLRAEIVQQTNTAFPTTGTAPDYKLTPTAPILAYAAGQRYNVQFHAANVGPNTLDISALGTKALKIYTTGGTKIDADVFDGWIADVEYDGTDFVILGSPQAMLTVGDNSTIFTATGDWTCPSNITSVELLLVAAGGGGAGGVTNTRGGGGGGGGQSVKKWVTVVPGTVYTITIGAGGTGGAAGGSAGAAGGDSTMTGSGFTTITMAGGGGASGTGNGGDGGGGSAGALPETNAIDAVYKLWFDAGSTSEGAPGGGSGNIGLGQPAAGIGGDDWDFVGGNKGTTSNASGPGGGGGASTIANGGSGSSGGAVAGTNGILGSGGGGGSCSVTAQSAGGNGGNGYGRIRY